MGGRASGGKPPNPSVDSRVHRRLIPRHNSVRSKSTKDGRSSSTPSQDVPTRSSSPDETIGRPEKLEARQSIKSRPEVSALADADISIIDHVPDRALNRIRPGSGKASRGERAPMSKRQLRDHAIRMLKNPRATLSILGGTQQGIRLFQKFRPDYSGGMHFHAGNVASFISRYRMFHNVADWLSIYSMIKEQLKAGLRGDKFATVAGWGATLGYLGYLITEFLCFLGLSETFKLSRHPSRNARRCDDYDRRSAQAFTLWIVTKGIQHARERILDKRRRRERAERPDPVGMSSEDRKIRREEDLLFEKEMELRRAKRKRFVVINGAWAPAAIHWSMKKSPWSNKTGPAFAVLAQMCKVYYFWGDAKLGEAN